MTTRTYRGVSFFALLACAALLGAAYYLQYVVGIQPCPLCELQRIALVSLGVVFLLATLHGPGRVGARLYGVLAFLFATTGLALAARQVWLQHQVADPNAACLPGLGYLLRTLPVTEVLRVAVRGSAECAQVTWKLLGFSLAEWTLFWFAVLMAVAATQTLRVRS